MTHSKFVINKNEYLCDIGNKRANRGFALLSPKCYAKNLGYCIGEIKRPKDQGGN